MKTKLLKKIRSKAKTNIKAEIRYDSLYRCYYPVIVKYNYIGNRTYLYKPFDEGKQYQKTSIKGLKALARKMLDSYRRDDIIKEVGNIKADRMTNILFWF